MGARKEKYSAGCYRAKEATKLSEMHAVLGTANTET